MSNNSTVYWNVRSLTRNQELSLHTYAWSVKSFGGRRWVAGAKRGENIMLPHRQGRIYVPKLRESQTFDLNMWVFPTEEDGRKPVNRTIEQQVHKNWRKIISVLDQEGQFYLRKRWHRDTSTVGEFYSGASVESASALAEFVDASGPDSDDGRGFYGNITLQLSDPYFYGNQLIIDTNVNTKVNNATHLVAGENSIPKLGDSPTSHVWICIENATTDEVRITFQDGNWIEVLTGVAYQDGPFLIDLSTGTAVISNFRQYFEETKPEAYVNGLVRRNPYFTNWPVLNPNIDTNMQVRVDGEATIRLIYDPAYR